MPHNIFYNITERRARYRHEYDFATAYSGHHILCSDYPFIQLVTRKILRIFMNSVNFANHFFAAHPETHIMTVKGYDVCDNSTKTATTDNGNDAQTLITPLKNFCRQQIVVFIIVLLSLNTKEAT